jgi:hypothetical protein
LGAFLAQSAKNRAFRSNSSDLLMQILWDFRYNPLRSAAQNQFPELPKAIPGQQIAEGNLLRATRRSQLWNNCVVCHQVFLRPAAKKHVFITNRLPPPR